MSAMLIRGVEYRPFLLGTAHTARSAAAACPLGDALFVDIFAPESQPFYRLVNAGNARAFDRLGMPAWVQLDCCTLPTAMIGFAVARATVEPALFADLRARVAVGFGPAAAAELDGYRGWVPMSEYTALPSLEAGTFVGFSLYSLVSGCDLGLRTKALALACYRARRQIGITQYTNWAIRTHAAIAPLEILESHAPPHSAPEDTFVYRIEIDEQRLGGLVDGTALPLSPPSDTVEIVAEPLRTAARVAELRADHPRLAIVSPGLRRTDGRDVLLVARL